MFKDKLIALDNATDIPKNWRDPSIEQFIQAQNRGYAVEAQPRPKVLMSACMECRYNIPIPANFAYVVRTPGGRLIGSELAIGYAISRGVDTIIIVAHDDCGMTKLTTAKPEIIQAFIDQGWDENKAKEFVDKEQKRLSIYDEIEALRAEYLRLRDLFKKISTAPLFLVLAEKRVYIELASEEQSSKVIKTSKKI